MPRAGQTKPEEDRLSRQPSVPMTEGMLSDLHKQADRDGMTLAQKIRLYCKRGLEDDARRLSVEAQG